VFLSYSPGLELFAAELADDVFDSDPVLLIVLCESLDAEKIWLHLFNLVLEQSIPAVSIMVASLAVVMISSMVFVLFHELFAVEGLGTIGIRAFDHCCGILGDFNGMRLGIA